MHKTNRLFLLLILLMSMLVPPTMHASAALSRCRTDPIFKLSNGDIVTVTLEISTDAHNIRNINYVLHVPPGVRVTKVTYTAGAKKDMRETYRVYQDSPARTYTIDTVLTTQTPGSVAVTVYTRLNGNIKETVAGYNGEDLSATLSRP